MEKMDAELTAQQKAIQVKAQELLDLLAEVVPDFVGHWAVEDARNAASSLTIKAHTIHTHDWYDRKESEQR